MSRRVSGEEGGGALEGCEALAVMWCDGSTLKSETEVEIAEVRTWRNRSRGSAR